jgi:hypothetical protein
MHPVNPDFLYAPPTPSPGASPTTVPSPTTTTAHTTSAPMTKLPVTGPSAAETNAAWQALALGVVILAAGVVAIVAARVKRARTE